MKPRFPRREDEKFAHRINAEITAQKVRLVGENAEPGVYPTEEALRMAQDQEMDLVEISGSADPPVARIMEYSKFIYEQKKKQKELKSKSSKVVTKEIRFGPNTSEHDLDFKIKHAKAFLQEGSKIKAFVFFRGRSIVHTELGANTLQRFIDAVEEYGKPEAPPRLEGKRLTVFISPKAKK